MEIDHINIVVTNLQKTADFFALLGFTQERKARLSGAFIDAVVQLHNVDAEYIVMKCPQSSTVIELLQYYNPVGSCDPHISLPNQIGFRHIALKVDNIEAVVAKLKNAGVTFFSPIQEYQPTKKKLCYFYGPDGIILELAQYG